MATCLPAQHKIRGLTQHAPGRVAIEALARSGRKRHASRTDEMQLQFVAIGENCGNLAQIATARWTDSTAAASNKCKISANGPEVAGGHACNMRALFAAAMAVASSLRRSVVGSSEMSKRQALKVKNKLWACRSDQCLQGTKLRAQHYH